MCFQKLSSYFFLFFFTLFGGFEKSFSEANLAFFTQKTVIWLGHSQVIPFQLKTISPTDQTFEIKISSDNDALDILLKPTVLAGKQQGYFRVYPKKEGVVWVELAHQAKLEIIIKKSPTENFFLQKKPQVVGVVPGAFLWGNLTLGVEILANPLWVDSKAIEVTLHIGETILKPQTQGYLFHSPTHQSLFQIRSEELFSGPKSIFATVVYQGEILTSDSVPVFVIHPEPEDIFGGECEDYVKEPHPKLPNSKDYPLVNFSPEASNQAFVCHYFPNPTWQFAFEAKSSGFYQLMLVARADFGGGAYPSIALYLDQNDSPSTTSRLIHHQWYRFPVGFPVELEQGKHHLTPFFLSDFYIRGVTDRNLFLDRFEILQVDRPASSSLSSNHSEMSMSMTANESTLLNSSYRPVPKIGNRTILSPNETVQSNESPVQVKILYPLQNQIVEASERVLVQITPPTEEAIIELLIDGEPQNMEKSPEGKTWLFFPLILRNSPKKSRVLQISVQDFERNTLLSEPVSITLSEQPLLELSPYARALRLLNRFAYGPEEEALAQILIQGEEPWLKTQLEELRENSLEENIFQESLALYPQDNDENHIKNRVLYRLIHTKNPVRARFDLWVQNHFSTWIRKANAQPKWEEYQKQTKLGPAPFLQLLFTSATSAAMLRYLDQELNFSSQLNENYARELLELHTLGVTGGYTQEDVTLLAGLLNGWSFAPTSHFYGDRYPLERVFCFEPALNEGSACQIIGMNFDEAPPEARYDRVLQALEMFAAHPNTARFICRKLLHHYMNIPASQELEDIMQQRFLESGGDLKEVLLALIRHPSFWKKELSLRLNTPLDFGLKLARISGYQDQEILLHYLRASGTDIFERVTPEGYPEEDQMYASANAVLQQWKLAKQLAPTVKKLLPLHWQRYPQSEKEIQACIDFLALHLTGHLLQNKSNDTLLRLMTAQFKDRRASIESLVALICQLPEVHFR